MVAKPWYVKKPIWYVKKPGSIVVLFLRQRQRYKKPDRSPRYFTSIDKNRSLVWIAKKSAVRLCPSAGALLRTDDFSTNSVPIDPVLSAYRIRNPCPGEFPKQINLLYNPITGSCDHNQNPLPTRGTARLRGDADTNKFSGEMPRCSTCSQRSAYSTRAKKPDQASCVAGGTSTTPASRAAGCTPIPSGGRRPRPTHLAA
jgi:hypothetical protein